MEVVIRRGQVGDGEPLARLNGIVQQLHVDRRPDTFGPTRLDEVSAWFEARLADPNARVWLAEIEGRPVGYVLALFHTRDASSFTVARRWCEVDQIAVDPTARRRGVARALVAALAREAEATGVAELKAQTWGFNEVARRTFEELGFEVESVRLRRDARGG
jgi:GNAT superfamily N-acetyltransferase